MATKGQRNPNTEYISSATGFKPADAPPVSELTVSIFRGTPTEQINTRIRTTTAIISFYWSEPVRGFDLDDVRLEFYDANDLVGSIEEFAGVDGSQLYTATLNVPDESLGEVDVIIEANVATAVADMEKMGPPTQVRQSFIYNTSTRVSIPPSVSIREYPQTPWRNTQFPVVATWTEDVTQFVAADLTASVGTLSDFTEEDPDVYTALLTLPSNATGTCTLTILADAAQGASLQGPETEYTFSFDYDTTGQSENVPGATVLCSETYAFADNPHFSGAFAGILEMLVHDGYIYFIVQFIRDKGSAPVNFLADDTRGAAALFRVAVTGGTCERLAKFDDVLVSARSLAVFKNEVHYFKGSHYLYQFEDSVVPEDNPNWRTQVGELWKLVGGTTDALVGKTGRTGQTQRFVRPGDEDYNAYYGIRGGTASPLVADTDNLYLLSGFGDLRDIGKYTIANKEVDDIRNWTLMKFTETIETRLPVLETNDRPGWASLNDLAQLTRSRVGFRGAEFQVVPSVPRTAKIKTAITDAATTVELKELTHTSIPTSGLIFVEGELITYSGVMGTVLTGLHRGAYETTADGHLADVQVVFVDHQLDTFLSFSLDNATSQVYNVISIEYADGTKDLPLKDRASISAHGRHELPLQLPMSKEQTAWARNIAAGYLSYFKEPRVLANITVPADYEIYIGDVVFIDQTDRAHVFGCGEVVSVKNTISRESGNLSETTALKVKLI